MIGEFEITKVEHIWCRENDRWIYIEYNEKHGIIGLNFMQGDEYDKFKKSWCRKDQGLMSFYTSMIYTFYIEKSSVDDMQFINKVIWAYHKANVCHEDYNHLRK